MRFRNDAGFRFFLSHEGDGGNGLLTAAGVDIKGIEGNRLGDADLVAL